VCVRVWIRVCGYACAAKRVWLRVCGYARLNIEEDPAKSQATWTHDFMNL
jgi:hypothetical protein